MHRADTATHELFPLAALLLQTLEHGAPQVHHRPCEIRLGHEVLRRVRDVWEEVELARHARLHERLRVLQVLLTKEVEFADLNHVSQQTLHMG
jgi:hypothetical protein